MGDISGSKGDRFRTMATPEEVQAAMKIIYTDAEANEGPDRDLCKPVSTVVCGRDAVSYIIDLDSIWVNTAAYKGAKLRRIPLFWVLKKVTQPKYFSWFVQLNVEPQWYTNIATRCQSGVRVLCCI
jgi:hypothetical protein